MPVPFLDTPRPHAFAHRGGAAHAPENSWTAFEHAVKLGYAYLETDARATSDGKLVAFHDRTLDRVTGVQGPVGSRTYREVAALRVAGTEPVPLIEDLLGTWPGVRFNIDLKDEAGIPLLPGVLRRTGAWDRVCVTSFSGARLRTARKLLDHPVCMTTSPGAIAAVRYSIGTGLAAPAGPGNRRPACWPAGSRRPGPAARRYRAGWPPGPSSAALTPSAWTCTYGPSTTVPR